MLWEARLKRNPIKPLTDLWPEMTVDDAYAIQNKLIQFYLANGDHPVGFKLGFTSPEMRRAMGIHDSNYGILLASMIQLSPARVDDNLIHPRIEPEIAVRIGYRLSGTDVTLAKVRDAITHVAPALEIVDSRFEQFRFTFLDNTADNSSAAGVVLGEWQDISHVDLESLWVKMSDGVHEVKGFSTAVMGSPLEAVSWLVVERTRRGHLLPGGSVILTGGMTAPFILSPGTRIEADFGPLGRVVLQV